MFIDKQWSWIYESEKMVIIPVFVRAFYCKNAWRHLIENFFICSHLQEIITSSQNPIAEITLNRYERMSKIQQQENTYLSTYMYVVNTWGMSKISFPFSEFFIHIVSFCLTVQYKLQQLTAPKIDRKRCSVATVHCVANYSMKLSN